MTNPISGPDIATLDVARGERLPDYLIHDGYWLGDASALRGIVLPSQGQALAQGLLEMEAPCVYLGEAALLDGGLVASLAQSHGSERIGVFVPASRMEVSWSLETQSNADFKTLAPSLCEPAWEILRADGSRTGTFVHWWLAAMFERGASSAIVQIDMTDDVDLNLCATLVEAFGDRLRFAPRSPTGNDLNDWVNWGKAMRLGIPFSVLDANPHLREPAPAAVEGAAA